MAPARSKRPTEQGNLLISDEEANDLALMRTAIEKQRGYADHFSWPINRDIEEWGVVSLLEESMQADGAVFFLNVKGRGRPNDPPDCEALTQSGARVAIEVSELVDPDAIRASKRKEPYLADWSRSRFLSKLADRLSEKDTRFPRLKEPPYDGGYVLVVHTDEQMLSRTTVGKFLAGHLFETPKYVTRAFLILGYDPIIRRYPYFELAFR